MADKQYELDDSDRWMLAKEHHGGAFNNALPKSTVSLPVWLEESLEGVSLGLGRIVALYHRSSTLSQIH